MEEYVGFIDRIGKTDDGRPIYRFDFTYDKDAVWGEFFNVAPAGMMPVLEPDKNTLSHSGKAIFPKEIDLARNNMCYSMQDCFDGIIALAFSKMDNDNALLDDKGKPFVVQYGETLGEVKNKLGLIGLDFYEFNEVKIGDDSALTGLMNNDNGEESNGE